MIESEPKVRKRTASKEKTTKTAKGTNIIRLPISELKYLETVKDPICFRQWLNGLDEKYKLLFDADLSKSYQFHDIRYSKKNGFALSSNQPFRANLRYPPQFYYALLER